MKTFLFFIGVINCINFGKRMENFQNHHFKNSENSILKTDEQKVLRKIMEFDNLSWTLEKFRQLKERFPQETSSFPRYFRKYISIKLVRRKSIDCID